MADRRARVGRLDDSIWNEPPPADDFALTRRMGGRRLRTSLLLVGLFVALWLVLWLIISAMVLRSFDVPSDGMSPTIQPGQHVAVLLLGSAGRQDIVILHAPPQVTPPGVADVIKRVVAVGGDSVSCCRGGHLVVNGTVVHEPYASTSQMSFPNVRIPQGDMFVLGDNRLTSEDSRNWGPVRTTLLVGRVVAEGGAILEFAPLALSCIISFLLVFGIWVFWIRRTTLWRDDDDAFPEPLGGARNRVSQ